jgi:hypothetical protein
MQIGKLGSQVLVQRYKYIGRSSYTDAEHKHVLGGESAHAVEHSGELEALVLTSASNNHVSLVQDDLLHANTCRRQARMSGLATEHVPIAGTCLYTAEPICMWQKGWIVLRICVVLKIMLTPK